MIPHISTLSLVLESQLPDLLLSTSPSDSEGGLGGHLLKKKIVDQRAPPEWEVPGSKS